MHVVLAYLERFRCNSLLECVSQPEIGEKITKNPYFGGSRSSKVIDVDTTGKLVGSACYDRHQVCLSATVFTLHEPIMVK